MSLPFVRLSTVGNDFDLLERHEDAIIQSSEEILEEKLRQIHLSTLTAKKRLRKNYKKRQMVRNIFAWIHKYHLKLLVLRSIQYGPYCSMSVWAF